MWMPGGEPWSLLARFVAPVPRRKPVYEDDSQDFLDCRVLRCDRGGADCITFPAPERWQVRVFWVDFA